ncbi:hypothetical protein FQA39_LY16692 [Lamprigera yunnana]|nr:hypothetical protein FQA39_LY16692 [Lamprigera yunnana]
MAMEQTFIEKENEHFNDENDRKQLIKTSFAQSLFRDKQKFGMFVFFIISIFAIPVVVYFIIMGVTIDTFSEYSCAVDDSYKVPLGRPNISRAECFEINGCFDDFKLSCYHFSPSKYNYNKQDDIKVFKSSQSKTPFLNDSIPTMELSINEIDKHHLRVVVHTPSIYYKTTTIVNKTYIVEEDKNRLGIRVFRNTGEMILTTLQGPLIASTHYWEWSILLISDRLFGLGEIIFPENSTVTKVIYKNRNDHNTLPNFIGYSKGYFYGVLVEHDGPLEVTVLPSKLIILKSIAGERIVVNVYTGPTINELIQQFRNTSSPISIPYWILGAHICRDGITTINETLTEFLEFQRFQDIQFSSDCIHENLYSMQQVEPSYNLSKLVQSLQENSHFLMTIPPQVLKNNTNLYNAAVELNILYKSSGENNYNGTYQNNEAVFPDYSHSSIKHWFDTIKLSLPSSKIDGFFLKDNWPEDESYIFTDEKYEFPYLTKVIRESLSKTIPWNLSSYGVAPQPHIASHNFYGTSQVHAFKNFMQYKFLMTSSFQSGMSETVSIQNVDISWSNLKKTIITTLYNSMFGNSLVSVPICGSTKNYNAVADEELCIRWYITAATLPIFRVSSDLPRRDPFSLNSGFAQNASKNVTKYRYMLLPYYYTILSSGNPLVRPMFYNFHKDNLTWMLDEQYMVGDGLLVVQPTLPALTQLKVYLPVDVNVWYEFWGGNIYKSGWLNFNIVKTDWIMFIAEGHIIPIAYHKNKTIGGYTVDDSYGLAIALNCSSDACFSKGSLQLNTAQLSFSANKTGISLSNIIEAKDDIGCDLIKPKYPMYFEDILIYGVDNVLLKSNFTTINLCNVTMPELTLKMAGNEGSGQTDLLTGWSCVVHRPSEDPEPSELPSTVDMAAFSSGISVEPTQSTNQEDSCDSDSDSDSDTNNSGSDVSGSCSQSDSSDSESSSSSQESSSRSSSPEFSVTSSQTNGLRLKIATVRKSCTSPIDKSKEYSETKFCDKPTQNSTKKVSTLSSSSESPCSSSSSESEAQQSTNKSDISTNVPSDKSINSKKPPVKAQSAVLDKKPERKPVKVAAVNLPKPTIKNKTRPKRTRKASLSHDSSSSSSDSEDCSGSDRTMLASCSLQEIRQEDLAAILPDQQECDTFGGFDCRATKNSPQTGDGSGSDMELPQQAVNALIQRTTESSSESESRLPLNPNTLYANSLLQQFVAQTQMLNVPNSVQLHSKENITVPVRPMSEHTTVTVDAENTKRKRGRPRKTNVSKVQNNCKTDSTKTVLNLEYCGNPNVSPDSGIQNCSDHVSSPEPSPIPNLKVKQEEEQIQLNKQTESKPIPKTKNTFNVKKEKENEQRKLPVTSNSFDRVLYGNTDRVLYPPRRKAGRPPASTRKGPGRPPKYKPQSNSLGGCGKSNIVDQDNIKQSKNLMIDVKTDKQKHRIGSAVTTSTNYNTTIHKKDPIELRLKRRTKSGLLHEICERVSKRLDISIKQKINHNLKCEKVSKIVNSIKKSNNRVVLGNKNKDCIKSKYTTLKNYKVMHSKDKGKKHKKCKFKILKPLTTVHDQKISIEIDKLVADFVKYCNISPIKVSKENVPEMLKVLKKASKKRKASDYSERKKKKQNVGSTVDKEPNSNEQRLPLKKRHYHLTNDVNSNTPETEDTKSKMTTNLKDNKHVPSNKPTTDKGKNVIKCSSPATVTIVKDEIILDKGTQNLSNALNDSTVKLPKSKAIGTHIDEAIEACITKYSSTLAESPNGEQCDNTALESPLKQESFESSSTSITATTPKKRHRLQTKGSSSDLSSVQDGVVLDSEPFREVKEDLKCLKNQKTVLENVVSELKAKKHLPSRLVETNKKQEKKPEIVSQVITRKKNRLEDLTLTLAHKVNSFLLTEVVSENTTKRKKELIKIEDSEDTQKRKKEASEPLDKKENILKQDENQKNKKDLPIIESTIDTSQKQKKENTIEPLSQKRSLEAVNDSPLEFAQTLKLKKESRLDEITSEKLKKEVSEFVSRASVIKSPVSKKTKPTDNEKLDCVMMDKPTGIFMPTIDIELHIPASKIQTTRTNDKPIVEIQEQKPKIEIPCVHIENLQIKDTYKQLQETESAKGQEIQNSFRKKVRKRRSINRTGFPTVKKKKKKNLLLDIKLNSEVHTQKMTNEDRHACDRVPQEGEKYSTFLRRTEKLNMSNVLLEKLQNVASMEEQQSPKHNGINHNDKVLECNLPLNRSKEEPPSYNDDDLDLKGSILDGRDPYSDLDELSLEARLELMNKNSGRPIHKWETRSGRCLLRRDKSMLHKRRLRDVSPTSSVDTFIDKKIRDDNFGSGDESKRTRRAPRWRKKYLPAGLFSDYYKEDDDVIRQKRAEAMSKTKIIYKPEEHPYGLFPPPQHCGKYLRCRKLPFQLPYDLWWQHTNSQLPGRDIVPSWNYRKIRTNVYNVRTVLGACEPQPCNCSPISQCGDDCINRLVLAECPATHKCRNQRIQKHDWAPGIEKFMTVDKGWGVRTKMPIKSGEFILEYVGEVVADYEFKERMASRYAHDIHHYCLHFDGGFVIDGHRMGGDGRFVNHSCEPNCEMQKWSVNGQFRMALFALRDIKDGEEITYDYNFSLFNPAEGQECKCGSANCRGVIGGKSQRVRQSISSNNSGVSSDKTGRVGRPRKNQAKRSTSGPRELPIAPIQPPTIPTPTMKPMTNSQKMYVHDHHCFLLRNLNRSKQNRERSLCSLPISQINTSVSVEHNATTFMNHLNALRQPRNIRTRRLAQAEDDPKIKKIAQLASILKDFLKAITSAKDEKNDLLCTSFLSLPSKRKVPEYYQRITEPIDLTVIEQNVATGVYHSVENFDADMSKVFLNAVRFFGRTSEPGIAATRLKKIYVDIKQQSLTKLEEVIGEKLPSNFISNKRKNEEEDVIRCICGMFKDEGLMIQCERCLVWQHCECVQADVNAESYHCEVCIPRDVDYEIPLDEFTEHGHRYYLTLLRGDLQLRQGDTVYVLRDIPITGTDRKHTYDTIGDVKYSDLDIFRVERLWKDSKTGQRFAYGHHYLRPHETFHEPTRKFFPNEVMRVPLYEAVPVELVISNCWVMDLNTYCKGRPIGAPEEHIYICEYRVDKSARLFSKISKAKYPICVKTYAFERFDVKLKISRTYTPHDLDPAFIKPRGRKPVDNDDVRELQKMPVHVPVLRTSVEKKIRLNKLLLVLLSKMPTKQALDVSYLLEGGRRRKKQLDK